MTGYEKVLEALGDDIKDGRFLCPVHGGHALKVDEGDDGVALVCCFAGCGAKEVVKALGLDPRDLWGKAGRVESANYIYTDEEGVPLLRVVRWSPKGFTQQRMEEGQWVDNLLDTRRVPYHLPLILRTPHAESLYLVEGEKDADNLIAQGYPATTLLGGAGKWRPEYEEYFRDRYVCLVGDNDTAGRMSVAKLKTALKPIVRRLDVLYPSVGKDVTDHLLAGHRVNELEPERLDDSELGPFDWQNYVAEKTEWLFRPFVPRGSTGPSLRVSRLPQESLGPLAGEESDGTGWSCCLLLVGDAP